MRIPGIRYVQGRNSYGDADGTKYGIAIHATANTAPASGEASYATRRTDGTSSHLYVDGVEVIQSLDLNARAGHAGSRTGNDNAIAVEITGLNSWTRQQWIDRVAWPQLGAALAFCCQQYGIAVRHATVQEMRTNPKVKAFYTHNDMRLAWGGTDHTDPGPNFPMDVLLQHVSGSPQEDDMAFIDDKNARILAFREHCWANMEDSVTTPNGELVEHEGVRAVKDLIRDVTELKARPAVAPAPIDAATLAAALQDPAVQAVLKAAAQAGAEAAEDS